ncbi:MAG: TOMM precursor leader peptide-binding protein [Legionellales bacterium]|nr:TOMM precursor leader peptide-binding protein [Legionellales bacterium]
MNNHQYFDKSYSILYHDENTVEFRSGMWNITTHTLQDEEKKGLLSKIILAIDESGFKDLKTLAQQTQTNQAICAEVIESLRDKNLLTTERAKPINKFKKISIISDNKMGSLLKSLLQDKISDLAINLFHQEDVDFILKSGNTIFSDEVLLYSLVEELHNKFKDSLVVVMNTTINSFYYSLLNKVFHEAGIPWFFSAVDGPCIYIGPLFDNQFCYDCLETRIIMNTKNAAHYQEYQKLILKNNIRLAKPMVNETEQHLMCSLASLELNRYLLTGNTISQSKLLSLYIPTMEFSYHKILRFPGCKVCGVDNALKGHQLHFDVGALLA